MDYVYMNWLMSKRFLCLGCVLLVKKSVYEVIIYDNLFFIIGYIVVKLYIWI